jgi:aminoglycoside/choline kinase family phosphotransferase
MLKNDARLSLIRSWLTRDLDWRVGRISVASADASFRRYFRVSRGDVDPGAWAPKADSLIVMDAPPGKEDIAPYLKVTALLEQAGVHVPHVYEADARRGFVVMEDLGDTQYLSLLRSGRGVDKLYGDALAALANIQVRGLRAAQMLDPYDRVPLERELNLMPEWFLGKHLQLELTPEERALLTVTFEFLINEAMLQPQVFVHRDFHSRNLMVLPQAAMEKGGPGVIDFQDALRGPIGYDLVSLLKDCYISWSRERVERWVRGFRRVLGNLGANVGDSEYQFIRWFDLIGVQRHIKVLGIFSRLWHRDGKFGYLADLKLTLDYVIDTCRRYQELVEFGRWLEWRVAPELPVANARQTEKPKRLPVKRKVANAVKPKAKKPKPKTTRPKKTKPKRTKPKETKKGKRSVARRKPPKRGLTRRGPSKRKVAKRKVANRRVAKGRAIRKVAKKRRATVEAPRRQRARQRQTTRLKSRRTRRSRR